MRLKHVSLTAGDAIALAEFYIAAFGCEMRRPPKQLPSYPGALRQGPDVAGQVTSVWLGLPGAAGPVLEILDFDPPGHGGGLHANDFGWSHIAVEVADLDLSLDAVMRHGGGLVGPPVALGDVRVAYATDPEGNLIELEARTV